MPQSSSQPHDTQALHERYGQRTKAIPRWLITTVIVMATVGVVALIMWIGAHQLRPTATYEEISHQIVSDTEVTITFNVNKPAEKSASCVVVAENKAHAQVGWKEIEVAPAKGKLVQITTSIATSERASMAEIVSCELID